MAGKRPRKPSRPARGSRRRKPRPRSSLLLIGLGLLVVALMAGALARMLLTPAGPAVKKKKQPPPPAIPAAPPVVGRQPAKPATNNLPLVAIIIDDMGYRLTTGRQLLALDLDLTFSFLPYAPHTPTLCRVAQARDRDILLHLPLEATNPKWNHGPGTLRLAMSQRQLTEGLARDLAQVPMAIGINNHMGSRFTENPAAMAILLAKIRQRRLFFVDSLTSPRSVALAVARQEGVRALARQFFLDNVQEVAQIKAQLAALLRSARKRGWAIGIGHPYPATVAAIRSFQPRLRTEARLVGLSQVMARYGR